MTKIDTQIRDVERLSVLLQGRQVGAITLSPSGTMAFSYDEGWLRDGFSISPLSLPLRKGVYVANRDPLYGMFGVFDDSMPDGWGRLLTDRLLRKHGADPHSVGMLTRLSIVGSSGMGALEYKPETQLEEAHPVTDLDDIARECASLLSTDFSEDLDRLFALGGSSGGARPKIMTNIDGEEWIVKFPSSVDGVDIGKEEYQLSLLAKECGITMPETRLFPSSQCPGYFGVKRFDRVTTDPGTSKVHKVHKVHMISAGGLLETSHCLANLDYALLMRLTMRITDDPEDCERLYRLMCFNVFAGNRDDHAKNFSYLYEPETGRWTLSPAYDLTENPGMNAEHTTAVNGKGKNIGLEDLAAVGMQAGMAKSRCLSIARDIRQAFLARGITPKD